MRRGSRRLLFLIGAPAAATTTFLWTRPEMHALLGCARPSVYPPGAPFASLAADLAANPTVFGALLRDELPRTTYYDDADYVAFRNVKRYAALAALVIPKRRLRQDPDALTADELPVVERLKAVALDVVAREQPAAFERGDYLLRFHRRPFNSVDHLHLHVLAPASSAPLWTSVIFFDGGLHAADVETVLNRLRREAADGGDD